MISLCHMCQITSCRMSVGDCGCVCIYVELAKRSFTKTRFMHVYTLFSSQSCLTDVVVLQNNVRIKGSSPISELFSGILILFFLVNKLLAYILKGNSCMYQPRC